ncbi:hypothetical protein [Psychroserpens ponticola]|uniref:Fn3-like domain-containing protein n=1 Tax=Psychroserpens ponticola TaxID=2932268 RepID=A0ABY7S3N4_9FLAO|nr:hypothetical protein [Psychroserpens ponticola]WCO03061.1 hypothetical protein MUN68_006105 [Psychroserpens ponticola]
MKLIATLIIACFAMTLSASSKNDCSAQLIVEKNRNSKSADEDGAQFILVLTNTSQETKTFNLSAKNLSEPCNNNNSQYNRGTSSESAPLDVSFQNNGINRNNANTASKFNITLNSGESYKFIVNAEAPKGTPLNTWSCIEVEAKSTDCKSISETQTLSVYVADPSEG